MTHDDSTRPDQDTPATSPDVPGKETTVDDNRPLVALDIDGVLNPTDPKGRMRGRVPGWKTHRIFVDNRLWPDSPFINHDPRPRRQLPLVLNPDLHGPWITDLRTRGADVRWASTWPAVAANKYLAPLLNIEPMPSTLDTELEPHPSEHVADWKARQLLQAAADRPLVFIDDQLDHGDSDLWSSRDPNRTLLIETDPRVGMTREHMDRIDEFVGTHLNPPTRGTT
ncbi:MAG: HAD domain-containing protein [Gordonia sp. (in: high G+C Gram-positive bacteria)]|uniref:HAD domain-containing protein n=1 Tax=Gordonia sp. (in: high G+C Gram-positive bacteria) TaxID=84139 RepID=UPI0039E3DCA0